MQVLNPNEGTVHLRDHLSNTFINLKPGINELSESQVATFGKQFASAGVELVFEMFDTPDAQAEPLQEAAPELEPLNEKEPELESEALDEEPELESEALDEEPELESEALDEEPVPGVVHTEDAPKRRGGRPKKVEE